MTDKAMCSRLRSREMFRGSRRPRMGAERSKKGARLAKLCRASNPAMMRTMGIGMMIVTAPQRVAAAVAAAAAVTVTAAAATATATIQMEPRVHEACRCTVLF